jgi:hypothetical protein
MPIGSTGSTTVGRAHEQVEQLADGALAVDRVPKWQVGLDPVLVAATVAVFDHVAGVHEVGDDGVGPAFGDSHGCGDVTETRSGVGGDAQQSLGVVREEAPTSHEDTITTIPEMDCMFRGPKG